jgi:hypothetical protein
MARPPSWNEIRTSAAAFAARWADETDERAEAQTFWNEFLAIFGIDRRRVAVFEKRAQRTSTAGGGFIDIFWPGTLIAEHKSAGKSLEEAEQQAIDYLESIDVDDFPGLVITSDFATIRIRDLGGDNEPYTFPLTKLPEQIDRLGNLAGYKKREFSGGDEEAANVKAAKLMGRLYEELSRNGYEGHDASILLVRLLFLMFGDDTGMWEKGLFAEFVEVRTRDDGSDLGPQLAHLFQVLDKEETARPEAIDELLARFPYVNGHLFAERIDIPAFDRPMRDELVAATEFDWGKISPAVFGSLFQSIKSKEARRELGEHYTTEDNIMKALGPLFLDDLWVRFEAAKNNAAKLERLHEDIAAIRVLDPACGCGNFLVIAYRHLRRLELAILRQLRDLAGERQLVLDVAALNKVRIDHFYGIEIEEWPLRIAETAMFLVDQQANHDLALEFGRAPDRLPIRISPVIHHGNALRINWNDLLASSDCSYVVGNPPFIGKQTRSPEQQEDMALAFGDAPGTGNLDYVAAWYGRAASYIKDSSTECAFVSTSSISQGEQASVLWPALFKDGVAITFAYRPFKWSSEAPGSAQVSVVIVGFGRASTLTRQRLVIEEVSGIGLSVSTADMIGPYLTAGSEVVVKKRREPIGSVPPMAFGSMPNDGGNLVLSADETDQIRVKDPTAAKYLRRFFGAQEVIDGTHRWCIWAPDPDPRDVNESSVLRGIAKGVRDYRQASSRAATRALADFPLRFGETRQPTGRYLAVPRVSSEHRAYLPTLFLEAGDIASDALLTIDRADEFIFGVLSSKMFLSWLAGVGGRLESRFRVSAEIVYNNFPFPACTEVQRGRIEEAARAVLDSRSSFSGASLADLYNPAAMPESLVRAHITLDAAVDSAFGGGRFKSNGHRLSILIARYAELTANLFTEEKPKKSHSRKN